MLKKQPHFKYSEDLLVELVQAKEEGKVISNLEERVKNILSMDDSNPSKQESAGEIFDEIDKITVEDSYKYIEPSNLDSIRENRKITSSCKSNINNIKKKIKLNDEELLNKIYGAWLGRCAGCLLGKPIEGWYRERILGLLKDTNNYPFNYYISSDIDKAIKDKYGVTDDGAWVNLVKYMPEDDDTNYTVIGLKLIEKYGKDFTADDVAECWLQNLPILHLFTAERVAYKNLVNSIYPPESASHRNPYRELIGAQIRADFFGYVNPGDPERAAEFAFRDASISHVKNGIYGEMFIASMLAEAVVSCDIEHIIRIGLSQIPEKSRLHEKVLEVFSWKKEGLNWDQAIEKLHSIYDEKSGHDWCHTISNAMIVCIGLIYGELDFEKSIGIAVAAAFDTDCNGATVGSIVGMILGAETLPEKWINPLNDSLHSGVDGFGLVKISEMAKRTLNVIKNIG
ncbi:MAG TPA: ADP-ribosylglycohydrolase family protein [Clostridiaceae bacterium]